MSNSTQDTIRSSIALMEERLLRASTLASMAHDAMKRGEQNLAIGTLSPVQQDITDIDALMRTVVLLHRSRPDRAG
ncbi:MAG: hypothetical protein AB7L90_25335 [Hyphomicrobiaceae bacterium]